jgi:hypothetical protein
LKTSEVVDERATAPIYSYSGICQPATGERPMSYGSPSGLSRNTIYRQPLEAA